MKGTDPQWITPMLEFVVEKLRRYVMTTNKETMTAAGEAAGSIVNAAHEVRRSAAQILDKAGSGTAEALHTAASAVRTAGVDSAAVLDKMADGTGRRLASASSFVDPCSTEGLSNDLRRTVRRHPGAFLLATATLSLAVGFMAGMSTRDRA